MSRARWAVFISGRGSNLAAILECRRNVDVVLVVSSSAKAAGLARARRAGVPTLVLAKPINWADLQKQLLQSQVEKIFLAGFMRLLPADFVASWEGCVLNVHPSLLPAYPGLNSLEKAYSEESDLGVTVHEVIVEMDQGAKVFQRKVISKSQVHSYSLQDAEFLTHVNEHRLVREAICKWKQNPMS